MYICNTIKSITYKEINKHVICKLCSMQLQKEVKSNSSCKKVCGPQECCCEKNMCLPPSTIHLWTNVQKQDIMTYLHSYVYVLAKLQLHILITYRVTALQSSNNRTIDLYCQYSENKIAGTYKNGSNLQTNWGTELHFLPLHSPWTGEWSTG